MNSTVAPTSALPRILAAGDLDAFGHAYPRPQLQRSEWISLNGTWDFFAPPVATSDLLIEEQEVLQWPETATAISVPFSPETASSGVCQTGFQPVVWYRKHFESPALNAGDRLLLHFGAVDYKANVWVNGKSVVYHVGGNTPFHADITTALNASGPQEIIVRAHDDPADLAKPRGKQDWKLEPHSIWYPRTTGIWQTVWLEVVPATYIETVRWSANLKNWEIGLEVHIAGKSRQDLSLEVRLHAGTQLLAEDTYAIVSHEVHRRIALSDPGIDDYRNEFLWSPSSPTLIDVEITLRSRAGEVIESIVSYTALREISVQGDRFLLNARPLPLRLVLDQGYWQGTGLTAPNDNAFLQDVLLVKELGFNGVRKHQKIEDPRFLYWADRIGLLVWEEMPSAYRYTRKSIERLTREWMEVLSRDSSHPCIVAWVPFNESWGVPDLPDSMQQREYVRTLYHLTRTLDATRPVIGNDGWESVATDIIGIHDYDDNPEHIRARYNAVNVEATLFKHERPGGRMLMLDRARNISVPIMLTEFGGIALSGGTSDDSEDWGYSRAETPEELLQRYQALMAVVRNLPLLAGFCYTQLTDTYQEANGLLYADRTPKAPIEKIALATRGPRPEYNKKEEAAWRERLMALQR